MKSSMKVLTVLGIAALSVSFSAATAHDNNRHREEVWRAFLFGENETPAAISTTGSGQLRAVINEDSTAIDYTFSYKDLVGGNILFAHIHFGQRHTSGGVMVFLCGGGGKPACPAAPATVRGTIVAADVVGPTGQGITAGQFEKVLDAIRSGTSYANLHTTQFGTGEIRGQLIR